MWKVTHAFNLTIFLANDFICSAVWKYHCLNLSKICLRLRPALSKCLFEKINWIILIPCRISKLLFLFRVPTSPSQLWKTKLERAFSFRVYSGETTVWGDKCLAFCTHLHNWDMILIIISLTYWLLIYIHVVVCTRVNMYILHKYSPLSNVPIDLDF